MLCLASDQGNGASAALIFTDGGQFRSIALAPEFRNATAMINVRIAAQNFMKLFLPRAAYSRIAGAGTKFS